MHLISRPHYRDTASLKNPTSRIRLVTTAVVLAAVLVILVIAPV